MNRLTRRTAFQFKPPLRGRLAAEASEEQKKNYSLPVIRERPSIPRRSQPKNYQGVLKAHTCVRTHKSPPYILTLVVLILLFWSIFELLSFLGK